MNNETKALVKKQMADAIWNRIKYEYRSTEIAHILVEKGDLKKVLTDMEKGLEKSDRGFVNKTIITKMIINLRAMKIKDQKNYGLRLKFIILFRNWWTSIIPEQAKIFISKRNRQVLKELYDSMVVPSMIMTQKIMNAIDKRKKTNKPKLNVNSFRNIKYNKNDKCPITQDKPKNPSALIGNTYIQNNGKRGARQVYDRDAITQWVKRSKSNPMTRNRVSTRNIVPLNNENEFKKWVLSHTKNEKMDELLKLLKNHKTGETPVIKIMRRYKSIMNAD